MAINLQKPDIRELRPKITVFGVGGAGGNAVNNMITAGLAGVEFVVANTDAQALASSRAERLVQMGVQVTEGLGAGSQPEVGRAAAEEVLDEIRDHLSGSHMVFVTAGMGGGTGTGASPIVARAARELGILTVGVVTKPFHFEGQRRMRVAEGGISELQKSVDTLIVIPNQNLFRVANERTTFADAFALADQVLFSGVACITDLMVKEGLINLDFADVRAVMREMGKAMMGTGEASGDRRAINAAEAAIANPLLDETSMRGARGLLISITGGKDLTLYEVDEAATRIREEVDPEANIILGATFDQNLEGIIRVSVVATGIDPMVVPEAITPLATRAASNAGRAKVEAERRLEIRPPTPLDQRPAPVAAAPAPVYQPAPAPQAYAPAPLPVEPARLPETAIGEVTIRPLPPKPAYYPPIEDEAQVEMEPMDATPFIPPAPERPMARNAPRMPRVEDFPLPGQAELRAARGEPMEPAAPEHHEKDKRKMTLLQRLAAVGLGRSADEEPMPQPRAFLRDVPMEQGRMEQGRMEQGRAEQARAEQGRFADPRVPRPPQPDVLAEYGKRPAAPRPAPHGLDPHGRPMARLSADEEQLDIPAFLRRQAN